MKERKKAKKKMLFDNEAVRAWEAAASTEPVDILGSYTGTPYDAYDSDDLEPTQDADDL